MPRRPRQTDPRTKIARARIRAPLTQEQLAERTGLTRRTIQRLERGETDNPPLRYLVNIAMALGLQLKDVVEDSWTEWKVFDRRAARPPEPPREER